MAKTIRKQGDRLWLQKKKNSTEKVDPPNKAYEELGTYFGVIFDKSKI